MRYVPIWFVPTLFPLSIRPISGLLVPVGSHFKNLAVRPDFQQNLKTAREMQKLP